MLALLVMVECSTATIDASALGEHLERELRQSARLTAICEDAGSVHLRSAEGGEVDLVVPLSDVPFSARARTVALALAEHLRVRAEEPPPAPASTAIESVQIEEPPRRSPWRIAAGLEAATTLNADGLVAGLGFEVVRTFFDWLAIYGAAVISGGRSDDKPLLVFIFRAGAAAELGLSETVDLDLGLRVEGGPLLGFDGGKLSGYFGGGPAIGLRWAFAPPVQLRVELAGIYTSADTPLFFLALGIAYDL